MATKITADKLNPSFADRVLQFHRKLKYSAPLPPGFGVLNPMQETPGVLDLMEQFYKKFYEDHQPRKFIVGINPGRHGAGTTGIPFTDSKRLQSICGIKSDLPSTHEVSALFVYDMIEAYGGAKAFYGDVYIQSMFPLALVREGSRGGWVNCNYYDDPRLIEALMPYMIGQLKKQVAFGVDTSVAYVLGKKNARYFEQLNQKAHLFERMIVLPHPRYIQQYRSRDKDLFIDEYIRALKEGYI
jgi:uracil-DNA glycosylase